MAGTWPSVGALALLLVVISLAQKVGAYHDVVIIHGLLDDKNNLNFMAEYIRQRHPGTQVFNLNLYPHLYSLEPMWKQVNDFRTRVQQLVGQRPVHLIGFSQGGLVARGVVQSWSNHTVRSLISLSAPQAGQFGDGFLRLVYPRVVRNEAFHLFYTHYGQHVSVANYWNDPRHQDEFAEISAFLAPINNVVASMRSTTFRDTMLRLKKLVLIGGPDDGVIGPWQSAQMGFYDANLTVVPMRRRKIYSEDAIGLRALDRRKALVMKTYSGVQHHHWHHTVSVIDNAILPYLD